MKHTYRVRIQPYAYYRLAVAGKTPLTAQTLVNAIEGAVIRDITSSDWGDHIIDLQLQRPSHEQALNEILVSVQQLGYSWLEATVTEWADNTLGGALVGLVGCGWAGSGSGDAATSLGLAVVGSMVGAAVGSFIDSVKVVYEVHWTGTGWKLTPVAPATARQPAIHPRLA